jgi:TatD DNase family protein
VIEYFDSHCHLTDAAFRDDREAVLHRASEAGVTRLVCIASNLQEARDARDFARSRPGIWSTAGIHPHAVASAEPGDLKELRELVASEPGIVAIGETGLDYHYDTSPRAQQRSSFEAHLQAGADLGRPVVVHARSADDDVAAALRSMPKGTMGVLHCFTGGDAAFAAAMDADWYVSFSGIASFKSFAPVDMLREVPADRLLIETDAPYLAPVPLRGRRNEPGNVALVAAAVAAHLGGTIEEIAARTTVNACRFYGVA